MDIGDIIFLIILGLGFLSSLGGAKKRRREQERARRRQRSDVPGGGERATAGPRAKKKSRLQEARDRAAAQMEELLRELEGGPPPPPPAPKTEPVEVVTFPEPKSLEGDSPEWSLPPAVPPEPELPPAVPPFRDGSEHKLFHDRYIGPIEQPVMRRGRPRAKRHLSPRSLRQAILVREILGPPKGLE